MAGIPVGATGVATIIENQFGELLLQLRENRPDLPFANHWTLPGGLVEPGETPLAAAYRELREEIGVEVALEAWLTYERVHESSDFIHESEDFIIEQHIFVGQTDRPITAFILGEGVELRYVLQQDVDQLPIAYGFDELLPIYFASSRYRQSITKFDSRLYYQLYSFRNAPLSERIAILNAELAMPVIALHGYSSLLKRQVHEHGSVTADLKRFSQELCVITERLNAAWQTAQTSSYSEAALQEIVSDLSPIVDDLFGQLRQINSVTAEINRIFPEIPDLSQKFWQNAKHVWTTIKALTDPDI